MNSHGILVSSSASTKSKKQIMTGGTPDLEFKCPSLKLSKIYDQKWDPRFRLFTNYLRINFRLHHADQRGKTIDFHISFAVIRVKAKFDKPALASFGLLSCCNTGLTHASATMLAMHQIKKSMLSMLQIKILMSFKVWLK